MAENDMTRIKIRCNPYEHRIEYQRWNIEQKCWQECSEESILRKKEFCETTIQHNAYDILSAIAQSPYNQGSNGVEIVFEGTDGDYSDISQLIGNYFAEKGLICSRGAEGLISPKEAKEKIEDIYTELIRQTFDEEQIAPDEELNDMLNKFFQAKNQEIPICVMGTYSAGKSAFVNALLGAELLPSTDDPTTARIYQIKQASDASRSMIYLGDVKNERYIRFDDNSYAISSQVPIKLCESLQEVLENHKEEPNTNRIYYALSVINDYAIKDETCSDIGSLIQVEMPFEKGLLSDPSHRFVIYDTPGSNSESHPEHFDVLKKHLDQCTNGLPIIVTTNSAKDSGDSQKLLTELNKIRGQLDMTNAMVVINQADQIGDPGDLEESRKKSHGILEKWKTNRLYYASSIIGLGSRINNTDTKSSWCNKQYASIFRKNHKDFLPEAKDYYMQLYQYNRISKDLLEAYIASVKEIQEPSQLLYVNSGIDCIVKHIQEFADKYADYNKCAQASQYLKEAIEYIDTKIKEKQTEQGGQLEELLSKLDVKKRELINQLVDIKTENIESFENTFPNDLRNYVSTARMDLKKQLAAAIERQLKETPRAKEFVEKFSFKAEEIENNYLMSIKNECEKRLKKFQNDLCQKFCEKIQNANILSEEEKSDLMDMLKLSNELEDYDIHISYKNIRKKFLMIPLAKVKGKKANTEYYNEIIISAACMTGDIRGGTIEKSINIADKLRACVTTKLAQLNPELNDLTKQCSDLEILLKNLGIIQENIKNGQNRITGLTDFMKV